MSPAKIRAGRAPGFLAVVLAGMVLTQCSARFQTPEEDVVRGKQAFRAGDYQSAKKLFEAALALMPGIEAGQVGLLRTLRETGGYEEARKRSTEMLARYENSAMLQLEAGRIAAETGDYPEAEKRWLRAQELAEAKKDPGILEIRKELATFYDMLGRRTAAEPLWDRLIQEYRQGRIRGREPLAWVANAAWKRGYFQDAKDFFIDATDPKAAGEVPLEGLADFGFLFLEKFNATDAIGVFRDCLKINKTYPRALLGLALAKQYESNAEVEKFARSALEINPHLVPAICLLAKLEMEEENYRSALEEVKRALKVNPSSLEALALEASCHKFLGDESAFAATEARILKINPSFGDLYFTLAENYVMHRKYRESVEQNRKAIRINPDLSAAYGALGINLLRIGDLAGGREALQQAFERDKHNIWAFNTLDLLDQMDKFARVKSEHFVYLMAKDDEPSLAAYAPRLSEEAYDRLTRRYGFKPETPIQVEIFPDHAGFAVRTLGLPGLGALGVCFGQVVAIDSPRARKTGEFNWGSTLWHELAHVITLQMTKHNIPRWYSEGLSVYEERRARPGWGDELTPSFVQAYREGRLLKVGELNAGMMRPKFPEQIELSYFQASLFCELIESRFGFDKIPATLRLFAENRSTDEVFRTALGWEPATLESEYAAFVAAKLKDRLACFDSAKRSASEEPHVADKKELTSKLEKKPDDFFANLQMGNLLAKDKDFTGAEKHLKTALKLFPEYVGPGNAYGILSSYYLEAGRESEALDLMAAWVQYDEKEIAPLRKSAEIYSRRKNWAEVVRLLDLSVYIDPYEPGVFSQLAAAAGEAGDWSKAVSACQVLVALHPPDPAEAQYNLAKAYVGLGRKQEARRAVLKSLEIAPSFEKAQQLLLQISGVQP